MKGKMKRRKWTIPLLVLMLMLGTAGTVFSEPVIAHIFINPATSNAMTCDEHTIAVSVEDVEGLTAFDLLIYFDPDVVEIVDVVNGDFLISPEETALYSPDNNDGTWNVDGYIRFGLAQQRDPDTGVVTPKNGAGDLVLITMQALGPDQSTLFEIKEDQSMLVWWGEDPADPDGPVDGSPIEFTTTDGAVHTKNCPPIANDQTVTLLMNTQAAITLTGSDPDGDPLEFSLLTLPAHGLLTGNPPDHIYVPNENYFGTDSFTFRVNDGYDNSNIATVTLVVKAPLTDILLSDDTIMEGEPVDTVIGFFSTMTADPQGPYEYTLVAGDGDEDNASFNILDNALRSSEVFNYDTKNSYTIRVRSIDTDDPTLWVEKIFIIQVLDEPIDEFNYYFPLFTR